MFRDKYFSRPSLLHTRVHIKQFIKEWFAVRNIRKDKGIVNIANISHRQINVGLQLLSIQQN